MTLATALPLLLIATSLVPAVVILMLPEPAAVTRNALSLFGAITKGALIVALLVGVAQGRDYELRYLVLPDLAFVLRIDGLALLFLTLSAVLWLVTTVYAIGYLWGDPHQSRFFGFFNLCVAATMGIGLAGNLFTFLIFFELLTLSTYPLVVHRGGEDAVAGGRAYLSYAIAGGSVLFVAAVWLQVVAGTTEFAPGGVLDRIVAAQPMTMTVIFSLLIAGLGVKAALLPLHGWLPRAMVAPVPVSALLHAVAVVKAGVFGIARVVLDLYGSEQAAGLGVLQPLAALAAVTLLFGSAKAIRQDELKARLAYSTVAQLALITLGLATAGVTAVAGGLTHLVHQGLMKVTLFYCAGNLDKELGVHRVSQLAGTGWRMPITMGAFTAAALAMLGVPPLAGFVTKWHLGLGGLESGAWWLPVLIVASTLLTAAYLLPVVHAAWFRQPSEPWPAAPRPVEAHWSLLGPTVATALFAVGVGVLASAPFSPTTWASTLAEAALRGGGA